METCAQAASRQEGVSAGVSGHPNPSSRAILLDRDDEILGEMLDVGLHQCLKSYMIRGALVEQELFSRYERVRNSFLKLQGELEAQKADLEKALLSLAAKEEELVIWKRGEDKWRREVEMREKMVDGLKTSNSKKSAEISQLKEDLGHLEHELHEWNDRIKYLSEAGVAEKRERTDAQERARLDRLAAQSLRAELKEEQIALKKLREESIRATLEDIYDHDIL